MNLDATTTANPETATANPETATANPETATANPEAAATQTETTPSEPTTTTDQVAELGFAAYLAGKSDGEMVRVVARTGEFNRSGRGSLETRRVILPGTTSAVWADVAGETEGNYDRRTQNGTDYVHLPVGSLVVSYETETNKYGKGRAKLDVGVVYPHTDSNGKKAKIAWNATGWSVRRKGETVVVTVKTAVGAVYKFTF